MNYFNIFVPMYDYPDIFEAHRKLTIVRNAAIAALVGIALAVGYWIWF